MSLSQFVPFLNCAPGVNKQHFDGHPTTQTSNASWWRQCVAFEGNSVESNRNFLICGYLLTQREGSVLLPKYSWKNCCWTSRLLMNPHWLTENMTRSRSCNEQKVILVPDHTWTAVELRIVQPERRPVEGALTRNRQLDFLCLFGTAERTTLDFKQSFYCEMLTGSWPPSFVVYPSFWC